MATRRTTRTDTQAEGFTAEERAAMKERAKELRSKKGKTDPLVDLLAKIAELPDEDRAIAEKIHQIVTAAAPELSPRTWYGMPAYAKDGKILCFFQPASKFKARYGTLGFNDAAHLDDGNLWATSFGVTKITAAEEKKITALIKRAVG